jgi:hypothetical protein
VSRPPLDLTGLRVGRLVALRLHAVGYWLCACDCGARPIVATPSLRSARVRSCGCLRAVKCDKTGQRFGRLVALERVDGVDRLPRWRCRCDCGETHITSVLNLVRGHTRSCGCLRAEVSSAGLRQIREVRA